MSTWQPRPDGLAQLIGLLQNSQSPDNAVQRQVEEVNNVAEFQRERESVCVCVHVCGFYLLKIKKKNVNIYIKVSIFSFSLYFS